MPQPNILFILTDQHRYCTLPGVDGCSVHAPNLQRMRREGSFFTRMFTNYPLCSPTRGIIMSGQWPPDSGVVFNDYELEPDPTRLGHPFESAGYHTAYVGKWHLHGGPFENVDHNDRYIPPGPGRHGFSWMRLWNETNNHWNSYWYRDPDGEKVPYKGFNPVGMTDQCIEFLEGEWDRERPFFLFLSINPPHDPMHDAPKEYRALYDADTLELRPNVPPEMDDPERLLPVHGGFPDKTTIRDQLANYYAHVTTVDAQIGRLFETLERLGIDEDTCVIYTSDHGDMMGSQNLIRKSHMYQEVTQVPLIMRWPGNVPAGREVADFFTTIDWYPTLMGLAGAEIPDVARGMDLSHVALGKDGPTRDHALVFYGPSWDTTFSEQSWGIRTERWFYHQHEGETLYDHENDPFETTNVVDKPEFADVVAELREKLESLKFGKAT